MSSPKRRANLTPPTGVPAAGLPPTRRAGGARKEASERVRFVKPGTTFDADASPSWPDLNEDDGSIVGGWVLNISRGGLRAIVEGQIELGAEYDLAIGDEPPLKRGRIVWIQEESDGAIVGVEFVGLSELPPEPEPQGSAGPPGEI